MRLNKNILTNILGLVGGLATVLPSYGLDFGHFGSASGCTLITGAAVALIGYLQHK